MESSKRLTRWSGKGASRIPIYVNKPPQLPRAATIIKAPNLPRPQIRNPSLQHWNPWDNPLDKYEKVICFKQSGYATLVYSPSKNSVFTVIKLQKKSIDVVDELRKIRHPNLVLLEAVFHFHENIYIVSEFLDICISRLLAWRAFTEQEIASITRDVCILFSPHQLTLIYI